MEKNVRSAMLELMNMVFVLVDQVGNNFTIWHKKTLKINFDACIF